MSEKTDNQSPFQHASSSLDNLKVISYCPLCNTHYNPNEAKILEEKEGAHLIHIACGKCKSSIVAVIITGGIGVSSVGLITDLTARDVQRFKQSNPISEDDVLTAYELIQGNKLQDFLLS